MNCPSCHRPARLLRTESFPASQTTGRLYYCGKCKANRWTGEFWVEEEVHLEWVAQDILADLEDEALEAEILAPQEPILAEKPKPPTVNTTEGVQNG